MACIFTSATLSVARSMEYFKRKTGLTGISGEKTRCEFFESPFSPDQALRAQCATRRHVTRRNTGLCRDRHLRAYVELNKNILVLFTANAMLNAVHARCKDLLSLDGSRCLRRESPGTGRRSSTSLKFRPGRASGADSFWEGIDVPGKACEIVVIPRLPFQVPTHPLTRRFPKK